MTSLHALPLSFSDLSGRYSGDFAEAIRGLTGKGDILFTADGRNALHRILSSSNLQKTDEIILPAYTCKVLENTVRLFCNPVFADISPDFAMSLKDASEKVTRKTRAILLVHPYGFSADASGFSKLAEKESVVLIEDLAQAFGGSLDGKPLGSFGDFAFFSFRFSKDISCLTGGAAVSNQPFPKGGGKAPSDLSVRTKISAFLAFNQYAPVLSQKAFLAFSSAEKRQAFALKKETLSPYQLSLLKSQADKMPSVIGQRRKNAAYYLKHLPAGILPPAEGTFYRFPIRTSRRDALQQHLLSKGIAAERMYDYCLSPLPEAKAAAETTLTIPVHHNLREQELAKVALEINSFLETK